MENKEENEFVSATIPCDDCEVPIPYYDGKTLCEECYAARVGLVTFVAAKRTALEKALAAAKEKLEYERMMVATYDPDKVAGSLVAVDAIEALLDDSSP